jgi:hypothetical protein
MLLDVSFWVMFFIPLLLYYLFLCLMYAYSRGVFIILCCVAALISSCNFGIIIGVEKLSDAAILLN